MILADKIIHLRKKNGWSQEELAEMVSVSRQSVSKWESAASIPDINKIIELAKVFGVTTDFLLKDEMEFEEYSNDSDYSYPVVEIGYAEEFIKTMITYGKEIAFGVMMCILSPVALLTLAGLNYNGVVNENVAGGVGLIILLVMVAIAVLIFIACSGKMKKYAVLNTGEFELAYGVCGIVSTKSEEFEKRYSLYNAIGVVMCIFSVIPLIACSLMEAENVVIYTVSILLIIVAGAVYLFVSQGMIKSAYDQLLKCGDYDLKNKERCERIERIASFYWLLVVAIYLAISLPTNRWDVTWVIWPVAAVLYAGIAALLGKL